MMRASSNPNQGIAARRGGPAANTVGYRMLAALGAAPEGGLTDAQLMQLLAPDNRTRSKLARQAEILLSWSMVERVRHGLQILPAGRWHLPAPEPVECADAVEQPSIACSMATPRAVPVFKPLDPARLTRGRPQRDGMDDMRAVPSLMGSTRVVPGSIK